jgi:Zn-dependent peptidase ImmA (M78 family)
VLPTYSSALSVAKAYWDKLLPVNPAAIARAGGVDVRFVDLDNLPGGKISGAFGYDKSQPVILCNGNDHPNRQRFTVAHELGHMLLKHTSPNGVLLRDPAANLTGGSFDPREIEANNFAAALLMPEDLLRFVIRHYKKMDAHQLANTFGVPLDILTYQFKRVGIGKR